jgi:hypothetical protein
VQCAVSNEQSDAELISPPWMNGEGLCAESVAEVYTEAAAGSERGSCSVCL